MICNGCMINTLISLLRLIPTGDNSQQFRYKIDGDALQVFHDSEIAAHLFNQSNVASLLSLGMIVEVIETYSKDTQSTVQLTYATDFLKTDLWLTASFKNTNVFAANSEKIESYRSLLKERKTFRGFFEKKSFDFERMNKEFSGNAIFIEKLPKPAYDLIFQTESMIFDDYEAFKNIEKWFRYSDEAIVTTKTGMSLTNLNVDFVNGFFLKVIRRLQFFSVILRPYFKVLNFLKINVLYRKSVGFGIVVMNKTDNQAVVEAGRVLFQVWLKITEQKMAIQPISSASLLPFEYIYRQAHFLKKYEPILAGANKILQDSFKYNQGHGVWLFRFGVPDNTVHKKNQRSLRLEQPDLIRKD